MPEQREAEARPGIDAMLHQTLLGDAWEHASVAAAIFADDGRYLACNQAFCKLTGYTREQIAKMRVGVDLAGDEKRNHRLFREIVGDERTTGTGALRRADGSVVDVTFWAIDTKAAALPYYIVLYWEAVKRPKRRQLRARR